MPLTEEDLKALLRSRGPAARDRSGCPSAEETAAAAAPDAAAGARLQLAEHLRGCPACADEYRLLGSLGPWSERAAAALAAPAPRRARRAWPGAFAQAALVLLATGLVAWNASLRRANQDLAGQAEQSENGRRASAAELESLRRQLASLAEPQLDAVVADLEPRQAVRGGGAAPEQTLVVPEGARFVALLLSSTAERFPEYRLTLKDGAGALLWSGGGLRRAPDDAFTALLPARLLPPGRYRIGVEGIRGAASRGLEEYALTVRR